MHTIESVKALLIDARVVWFSVKQKCICRVVYQELHSLYFPATSQCDGANLFSSYGFSVVTMVNSRSCPSHNEFKKNSNICMHIDIFIHIE